MLTSLQISFKDPSTGNRIWYGEQGAAFRLDFWINGVSIYDEDHVTLLAYNKEEDGVDEFPYVFELVFAILDSTGNEVELVPSGSQISVTFENRLKFCSMAVEARLNEARPAAEAIASGVYAMIPQRALSLFTWEQLERAVKGVPEVSVVVGAYG